MIEDWPGKIDELLTEQYPYTGYKCDGCGWTCGHALVDCWYCPGKLIKVQQNFIDRLLSHFHERFQSRYDTRYCYRRTKEVLFSTFEQRFINQPRSGAIARQKWLADETSLMNDYIDRQVSYRIQDSMRQEFAEWNDDRTKYPKVKPNA